MPRRWWVQTGADVGMGAALVAGLALMGAPWGSVALLAAGVSAFVARRAWRSRPRPGCPPVAR
ncbi:hypothetical protein [Nocardiopsis alborubida]|uniref:Uncharacterized protein n=1 Tax=Nocardiopsis alborubida TaxID=146802 RepID=A0A7X6M9C1_9ACTN|nr:hypothetical protein [Nocardiopsis alborubida]NKY96770.1 hypothetical protein [Nocardiopsis alborubida]